MKTCLKCKVSKSIDKFPIRKDKGIISTRNNCKECCSKRLKDWANKNRDKVREHNKNWYKDNREKHLEHGRNFRKRHPIQGLLKGSKRRAIEKGIEFSLKESDIIIPEFCPILGIKIHLGGKRDDFSVSIDRIDNTKGYIKDNIVIISMRANRIKTDASFPELEKIYNFYKPYFRRYTDA